MNVLGPLLFYFPDIAFARYAEQALAKALGANVAARVWDETRERQKDLATRRPRCSLGVNLILCYMEWDAALYYAVRQAVPEEGIAEFDAKRLIEEINWMVFGPMIALSFKLSRLRSADRLKRVQWLLDLMFRVLFTAPFRRNTFPLSEEVAFDVVACPLAKYFKDQGVPELTPAAACALDHRMASTWGMTLRRTQTIAEGAPLCDFRFQVTATGRCNIAQRGVSKTG